LFGLKWQVSELPNEKEAVYGALDKWTAWETEFPLIAAAKALKILQQRRQWTRVIQVCHVQNFVLMSTSCLNI
jgi:hypothetical protein